MNSAFRYRRLASCTWSRLYSRVRNALLQTAICLLALAACPAYAVDPDVEFYQYDFPELGAQEQLRFPIVDIAQDKNGYLWLASSRGLIRYDGVAIKLFRLSSQPNLLSNNPNRLFVDSGNRLFVASERGLSLFENNEFRVLAARDQRSMRISAIAESATGVIWFGGTEGLWSLAPQTKTLAQVSSISGPVFSLLWHDNRLYVGGAGNLTVLADGKFRELSMPNDFEAAEIHGMSFHQGQVWAVSGNGLLRIDHDSVERVPNADLEGIEFNLIQSDRDQNLWLGSEQLIARVTPDGRTEVPSVGDENFGMVPELTAILEDSYGQHWHTSNFFGLSMLRDPATRRISYNEGLNSRYPSAVAVKNASTVYVATDKGISTVGEAEITELVQADFSRGATVNSLLAGSKGKLWVGTEAGLRVFDLERLQWIDELGSIVGLPINALAETADKSIFAATAEGLYRISAGKATLFVGSENVEFHSALIDSRGTLWLGTNSGVKRIVDKALVDWVNTSRFPAVRIVSIVELATGSIVAASQDRGIFVSTTKGWRHLDESDGLPQERILDLEANEDYLWVVTSAGIFRTSALGLSRMHADPVKFEAVAAVPRYRGTAVAYCCRGYNQYTATLVGNKIVAITDDGIIFLTTDVSQTTNRPSQPYIQSITVAGTEQLAPISGNLVVTPDDNNVHIRYSALDIANGGRVEFRYRLLGLSDEWIYSGKTREAVFQGLSSGSYNFELQASSIEGIWGPNSATLAFERTPAFTETNTFRVLIWAAAIALTLGGVYAAQILTPVLKVVDRYSDSVPGPEIANTEALPESEKRYRENSDRPDKMKLRIVSRQNKPD